MALTKGVQFTYNWRIEFILWLETSDAFKQCVDDNVCLFLLQDNLKWTSQIGQSEITD